MLSGDFDEHSASHLVSYPTRVASKELGTSGNRVANPHLINLATLEVDFHEGDDDDSEPSAEYFSWWCKAQYVQLPFVREKLFPDNPSGNPRPRKRHATNPNPTNGPDGGLDNDAGSCPPSRRRRGRPPKKIKPQEKKKNMQSEIDHLME